MLTTPSLLGTIGERLCCVSTVGALPEIVEGSRQGHKKLHVERDATALARGHPGHDEVETICIDFGPFTHLMSGLDECKVH